MRLYKCQRVTNYLLESRKIDERQIWCYAQAKMKINVNGELVKLYGMGLVCIKHDRFFVYNAEFNSTKMELVYSCRISEMQDVIFKKRWFSTNFCFVRGEEKINLDMDDWKRFASVFE